MDSIQNMNRQELINSNNSEMSKEADSNKKSLDYECDMNGNSKNRIYGEFDHKQNTMRDKNNMNLLKISKNQKMQIYPQLTIKHFIKL